MTSPNSKNALESNIDFEAPSLPELSPTEVITWLDGYRELMLEIWAKNPDRIPEERSILLVEADVSEDGDPSLGSKF